MNQLVRENLLLRRKQFRELNLHLCIRITYGNMLGKNRYAYTTGSIANKFDPNHPGEVVSMFKRKMFFYASVCSFHGIQCRDICCDWQKQASRKLRRLMWAIINIILINFRQKMI